MSTTSTPQQRLSQDYPWTQSPLIIGAPMRLIALSRLSTTVSVAGGLGFLAAGTDVSALYTHLTAVQSLLSASSTHLTTADNTLPIGIGVISWGASLSATLPLIAQFRPAALWLFSPRSTEELVQWVQGSRKACSATKIWVQIGSVAEAEDAVRSARPDVLVVQGTDAGGHGRAQGAGLIALLPEVCDAINALRQKESVPTPVVVAAGGISDGRGAAASLVLGAAGVVLGTRLLASPEAEISKGYRDAVLRTVDGGQTTVRTKVYDMLRGTMGWADTFNARGIINKSYTDAVAGMEEGENKKLYAQEMEKGDAGWDVDGRMTAYAGAGVGLVREMKGAADIVKEVREGAKAVLERFAGAAVAKKL